VNLKMASAIGAGVLGCALAAAAQTDRSGATAPADASATAPAHPAVLVTRFFTGADRRTHEQQVELQFGPDNVAKLPAIGAEFHWMLQGKSAAPRTAEQRGYIVTLSGAGENALIDGKKFAIGPGTIDVTEDTTGQGHYTNNTDDRLTVWLKLADTSQPALDAAAKASAAGAASKPYKPVTVTRLYNGADNLGHAEDIQLPVGQDEY
jgi:hypothetical protein